MQLFDLGGLIQRLFCINPYEGWEKKQKKKKRHFFWLIQSRASKMLFSQDKCFLMTAGAVLRTSGKKGRHFWPFLDLFWSLNNSNRSKNNHFTPDRSLIQTYLFFEPIQLNIQFGKAEHSINMICKILAFFILPLLTTIIILFFDLNKNVKETKNDATSNYSKMPFFYFF